MKFNQLKVGAVLSYISMGLGYIVSIIFTPIMLRLLGQSEYGLYNLVSSVVAYLGVLNFGFGSAYLRYFSRYKSQDDRENISNLNGMFLIIFSVIGLIAVIAGTILTINIDIIFGPKLTNVELSRAKVLMMILVLNIAISFPNIVFTSNITANERFIFYKLVQLVKIVTNPFIVLPVLLLGYGSIGMVLSTTALNIIIEIANALYCVKTLKMKFTFNNFDLSLMREMTIFSSFIFINLLIDQINWNVDKFILGRFHGTVSVAIYGLAAQLNSYYLSISTAISSVFIPRIHKLVAIQTNNYELTLLFTRIGRIQFIMLSLISSGLIFFGRPFINMWAGENYDTAYPIALLLIIPVTIPLIQNIGIEIQQAKNMHQFRARIYFFIALVNIGMSIPLSKTYGGVGAAFGTAFSLFIGNGILMNWYYHNRIGLDIKFFWKQIINFLPALIIPTIYGIIISIIFNLYDFKIFIVCGFFYVVFFVISMWKFGMNQYERDLFGKPIKKFIKSKISNYAN